MASKPILPYLVVAFAKAFLLFMCHKIIRVIIVKKALLLIFLCIVCTASATAIETSAKSAVLYDANTGVVLYEKAADTPREIASTTKIMTAILVIENADLNDIVKVLPEQEGIEGTSLYLKAGEQISVKTLLYGLMLRSGNDAAEVLARYVGGDIESFVKMMNDKAEELSMENTHFVNPHGLPAEGHLSTARDMAKLTVYAMKNETFRKIVSTKSYTSEGRSFNNHNKLLSMREEIDGVKTGYTKAAGRCLVSSAKKEGLRLVAVTLFDPNDWDDHISLYDMGYDRYKLLSFYEKNDVVTRVAVAGTGKTVSAICANDVSVVIEKESDAKCEVYVPRFCYAPIKKGDILGEIRVIKDGKEITRESLIAGEDVRQPEKEGFFAKIFNFLRRKINVF